MSTSIANKFTIANRRVTRTAKDDGKSYQITSK